MLLPSVWFDPFDIYSKGIKPNLPLKYQWNIEMPSEYFPLVFGALLFWTAFLTYHDLRKSSGYGNVKYTIDMLRHFELTFDFRKNSLAYLVKLFEDTLSVGVTNSAIVNLMYEMKLQPDPTLIIGELQKLNLVDMERIDPAPGSASSFRKSLHDLPYNFYTWSSLGKKVVLKLPPVERTKYYYATNSLYSRFSAATRTRIVSLNRNGLFRLLKRHSNSSK